MAHPLLTSLIVTWPVYGLSTSKITFCNFSLRLLEQRDDYRLNLAVNVGVSPTHMGGCCVYELLARYAVGSGLMWRDRSLGGC